jgi:hypothetical protein
VHGIGIHKLVFNSHTNFKRHIYSLESASGYGGKGQKTVEFDRHLAYNMRASLEGEKNLRMHCQRIH